MKESEIELLKSIIIDNDDAKLYDEVVSCYKNRLYRSGYLLSWILLIESLKRKILKLAELDDARGKQEWGKIETLEKQHQSTDTQIISSAKECEIISDTEYTTISSLWQQRCIFAHPYMQEVKSSDLEYIISKMIDITLSKPLYYSKKSIEEWINEIINYPHVVPTSQSEQENFIVNHFVRVKEVHYPFLYKTLFFNLSKSNENGDKRLISFFRHYIIKLILHVKVNINNNDYTLEKQMLKYPQICWLFFNIPETWEKLDSKFRNDLFRYIDITPKNNCISPLIQAYKLISKTNLQKDYLDVYYRKLQEFSIQRIWQLYTNKKLLLDRIWNEYIKDLQFCDQMKYVDFLDSFNIPISDNFDNNESETLGYFLGLCCYNNTFTALTFTEKCSELWINNLPFCRGLIRGIMTMNDNLYISCHTFSCVLSVIANLNSNNQQTILEYLENLPNKKTSNDKFNYDKIKQIYNKRQTIIKSHDVLQRINGLIQAFFSPVEERI